MSEEEYKATPEDQAIYALLTTTNVIRVILQAFIDGKFDKETYDTLFDTARSADTAVRILQKMLDQK